MTPKAQQIGAYDVTSIDAQAYSDKDGATHRRSASSPSSIFFAAPANANIPNTIAKSSSLALSISPLLNGVSHRVTSVISPAIIFSIMATPIAMSYPFIQLMLLLTVLIGTSPLYFIILTLLKEGRKHKSIHHLHHHLSQQSQKILLHRRQPSIVGSIGNISVSRYL